MKAPLILISLLSTSPIFSSAFTAEPWQEEWALAQKWENLQQARAAFTNGNISIAAPKLITLFEQGVLMSVPFLQKIEGIDLELKSKVMSLKTTSMARDFFEKNNISLTPQHISLLAKYSQKQDVRQRYAIAKKICEGYQILPYEELSYWYRFAGNMGDVDIQFLFSQNLRRGQLGFPQNTTAAFEWLERAAQRCDAYTQRGKNPEKLCTELSGPGRIYFDMGALFYNGEGTCQNIKFAIDHLLKSVHLKYKDAPQAFLGIIQQPEYESEYIPEQKEFHKVLGTPENLYELYKLQIKEPASQEEYDQGITQLTRISQDKKHPWMASANFELGYLLSKPKAEGESNNKFKDRIRKATRFLKTARENRHLLKLAEKVYLAIDMLRQASILNEYKADSFALFQEAYEQGAKCQAYIGKCHEDGIGTLQDPLKAIAFYERAIAQGTPNSDALSVALNSSGFLYMQQGNYEAAFEKFNEGVNNDFTASYYNLGIMWRDGLACAGDDDKAIELFLIAAQKGDKDAQYDLARMYAERRQLDEACFWYTQSAQQGHMFAKQNRIILFLEGFRQEGITLEEIKQDLLQNATIGYAESKLTLAMLMSCENFLSIPIDIQQSIYMFESLATPENERTTAFIAKIFLMRLKKEERPTHIYQDTLNEHDAQIIEDFKTSTQEIKQEDVQSILRIVKPTKTQKRLMRMSEATGAPPAPPECAKEERKPFDAPEFRVIQINLLREFTKSIKKKNIKPRELNSILDVFKEHGLYRKTASGYLLQYDDLIFSTHTTHDDSVDGGAIAELMTFIDNILQRRLITSGKKDRKL